MLTVAPMGRTKLVVRSETPMLLRTQSMVTGSVATELEVEKAVIWASRMPARNGLNPIGLHEQGHQRRVENEHHKGQPRHNHEAVLQQVLQQLAEHFGIAAGGVHDLACHQGKNEDGHGLHDHPHHAHKDLVEASMARIKRRGLVFGHAHQNHAKEHRKEDDLQHGHVGQRLKDVGGDHVDQWLQGAARFGALGLVQLVGHPIVHGDLLLRDFVDFGRSAGSLRKLMSSRT